MPSYLLALSPLFSLKGAVSLGKLVVWWRGDRPMAPGSFSADESVRRRNLGAAITELSLTGDGKCVIAGTQDGYQIFSVGEDGDLSCSGLESASCEDMRAMCTSLNRQWILTSETSHKPSFGSLKDLRTYRKVQVQPRHTVVVRTPDNGEAWEIFSIDEPDSKYEFTRPQHHIPSSTLIIHLPVGCLEATQHGANVELSFEYDAIPTLKVSDVCRALEAKISVPAAEMTLLELGTETTGKPLRSDLGVSEYMKASQHMGLQMPPRKHITSLAISPDGTRLVAAWSSHLSLWRQETRAELVDDMEKKDKLLRKCWRQEWLKDLGSTPAGTPDLVTAVAMHEGSVITGQSSGVLTVRAAADGADVTTSFLGHTSVVASVCISDDGRWMVSGSHDTTICLWPANQSTIQHASRHGVGIRILPVRTLSEHTDRVRCAVMSGEGRWIVSGSDDETVRLWVATTGACAWKGAGHTGQITRICVSPDAQWLCSASVDGTVRVWRPAQLQSMGQGSMVGEGDAAQAAQAAPSAKRLKLRSSSDGKEDAAPECSLLLFVCSPTVGPLAEAANEAVSILAECGWGGWARIYTEEGRYEHQLGCLVALSRAHIFLCVRAVTGWAGRQLDSTSSCSPTAPLASTLWGMLTLTLVVTRRSASAGEMVPCSLSRHSS